MKTVFIFTILVLTGLLSGFNRSAVMQTDAERGKVLFKQNCASCHYAERKQLVGIGLRDAWDEIPKPKEKWFIGYVQNPKAMHEKNDSHIAVIEARMKKYGLGMMTAQPLTEKEIKQIIAYVKTFK